MNYFMYLVGGLEKGEKLTSFVSWVNKGRLCLNVD